MPCGICPKHVCLPNGANPRRHFLQLPNLSVRRNHYAVDNIIETMLIDQKKRRQLADRHLPAQSQTRWSMPQPRRAISASALSADSPLHIHDPARHNCSLVRSVISLTLNEVWRAMGNFISTNPGAAPWKQASERAG